MKKMLIAAVFAVVAANSYQVEAARPRHMPHGARICHECKGDGRVRCGFLYFDSKRCLLCDGRGYILPKPPPPKPHPVVHPHNVPHKPVAHEPEAHKPVHQHKNTMSQKPMPVPSPKGGKGPR